MSARPELRPKLGDIYVKIRNGRGAEIVMLIPREKVSAEHRRAIDEVERAAMRLLDCGSGSPAQGADTP